MLHAQCLSAFNLVNQGAEHSMITTITQRTRLASLQTQSRWLRLHSQRLARIPSQPGGAGLVRSNPAEGRASADGQASGRRRSRTERRVRTSPLYGKCCVITSIGMRAVAFKFWNAMPNTAAQAGAE